MDEKFVERWKARRWGAEEKAESEREQGGKTGKAEGSTDVQRR
jgi:hypothetical protein